MIEREDTISDYACLRAKRLPRTRVGSVFHDGRAQWLPRLSGHVARTTRKGWRPSMSECGTSLRGSSRQRSVIGLGIISATHLAKRPVSALCTRWVTTRRMGEDARGRVKRRSPPVIGQFTVVAQDSRIAKTSDELF